MVTGPLSGKALMMSSKMLLLALFFCLGYLGGAYQVDSEPSQHHNGFYKRQSPSSSLSKQYPAHNITIPLDHFYNESRYEPHTNETFQNQYWLDTSNYVEGGPVIVNAMGEDSGDLEWLQKGLLQEVANATGGVAVLWGQRYYAGAMITSNYTAESLRFHTTEQALADLAYFSTHVKFPSLEGRNLTAPGTPWIIIGGSYAGQISAFTRIQYPNLFWGGITSSGITTGIIDFWQFYDVVRRYGPRDCIEMQQKFIAITDKILESDNKTAVTQLKSFFNAGPVSNVALANFLSDPMSMWQNRAWVGGSYGTIDAFTMPGSFCNNITSNSILFSKLANLTSEAQDIIANGGYANESSSILTSVLNWAGSLRGALCKPSVCYSGLVVAPFTYLACTEYGQFGVGYRPGDPGKPSALPVSTRLFTPEVAIDQCRTAFNLTDAYKGPDIQRVNKYGAINLTYPRLAISTGAWDIYRPAGPLAEFLVYDMPNPRVKSNGTTSEPLIIINQGGHEWDLYGAFPNETNSTYPPQAVKSAHSREIAAVQEWLKEWKNQHTRKPS